MAGVLGRYTIQVLPAAPAGASSLTLTTIDMVDTASVSIPVDQVLNATLAVGQACPGPGTPTPTPTPTQTPIATPTEMPNKRQ